jgi:hypothetical protein
MRIPQKAALFEARLFFSAIRGYLSADVGIRFNKNAMAIPLPNARGRGIITAVANKPYNRAECSLEANRGK